MALKDDIAKAIEASGISQAEIARRLGVGRDVINKSVKGRRQWQLEEIVELYKFLPLPPLGVPSDPEAKYANVHPMSSEEQGMLVEIGRRISEFRNDLDLTIDQLARGFMAPERLQKVERGLLRPTVLELDLIAARLNVSLDQLIRGRLAGDAQRPYRAGESRPRLTINEPPAEFGSKSGGD